ncbi:hypothetical protein Tco_0291553 [Tanacetum coccineum]
MLPLPTRVQTALPCSSFKCLVVYLVCLYSFLFKLAMTHFVSKKVLRIGLVAFATGPYGGLLQTGDTSSWWEYQLTDKEKEMERMMIYWDQVEYEVSDDDDSDLKSTARSVPKDYELEDTGDSSGI